MAAIVSNPLEVAMVRQIAAGTVPKAVRPNYSSLGATWATVARQEGVSTLFTQGLSMQVCKIIALNISLTGPYDFLNERLWMTFGDVNFNRPMYLLPYNYP